ncbi:aminopeptidase [Candidatus Falkowbacteria bacterium]|jgi:aspartyl aminopeptidase|nr:aminopeptidase [Candidatus Falkowbacteria bacterium]MBT4433146.1 aminopeptidase [Candidatus Falkowbacteria bacterium]
MSKEEKSNLEKKLLFEKKSCWEKWDEKKKQKAFKFCDGYKDFLSNAKTERESVKKGIKIAQANRFISIDEFKKKKSGNKIYFVNKDKNLALVKLGKDLLKDGVNFIVSHIDSPHLDLKVRPLYEEESMAFFKTHYYGGIKKYHWPTIPLALHGVIITKDGRKQEINIGEKEDEPIFMITDLLPHLARKQLTKTLKEAIEGEELNIVVGSIPVQDKKIKEKIKIAILEHLNKKYKIIEEDFFSAELQAVPTGKARDLGFDRSLIAGYGQDDRICAYTSLQAILDSNETDRTQICFWTDREEVGSEGVSGLKSVFLESLLLELLEVSNKESSLKNVYKIFERSEALSSDVTAGFDPDYKQVYDPRNSARLGYGLAIEKHTGSGGKYSSSEASAEYVYKIRDILNKNKVSWQTAGLGRIDEGGGGTIAMYLANRNIDTIDCGVALLNMHAPMEISSKADVYSAYEAYKAFFKE